MKGQALKELQTTANLVCPAGQAGATVSGTPATDCDRVNQEISALSTVIAEQTATPSAQTPTGQTGAQLPLATPSAQNKNLPNAKTTPPVKVSSPSGNLTP